MKLLRFRTEQPYEEDKQLAKGMLRNEEPAIREFMDIYFPRLYRFALMRMGDDASGAEDVVQQTLVIAARKIGTYRGEASLMTWLAQICRRELIRHVQKTERRRKVVALFDDEPLFDALMETIDDDNPLDLTERTELITMVHAVLDQLPNRNGDILEWKYIDGLSIREISEKLGMGTEAVQSQLARARR
ncbi:MAG: sigma-70 family RNA polymerase sigma factor, partial [Gammaproteobacteria bacterium]|nr:sigma-70 family RNA polymerase sigma factor [Gammaproteobacteria bacterium]